MGHSPTCFHRRICLASSSKLSKEERSDDAGQFVGKRAGRARAGMREERSADRSPVTAPADRISTTAAKQGPPEGGPDLTDR